MRILWHSNSPWTSTGYGNQTRLFTPRIKALGHDVGISAFYGIEGGILGWNGMPVYPKAYTPYGNDVVGAHATHFNADITISLVDIWVYKGDEFGRRWVPWYPVDMSPLPPPVFKSANQAFDRIVFSRFGERMTKEAGLNCRYVPHGVETGVFKPLDMVQARAKVLPEQARDKYIVGMVAANKGQPSRKAFEPQIRAFAKLHKEHPDTILYLHTNLAEHGENQGQNLTETTLANGLYPGRDVIVSDQYTANVLGFPDEFMVALYNSFDVLMNVSMGEGFGIPILEAQACGCPVIIGDWTSMSELCFSGWRVGTEAAQEWWTPLGAYQWQPSWKGIYERLEDAYLMRGNTEYRERARAGALQYDADRVVEKYWKPVLEAIQENL